MVLMNLMVGITIMTTNNISKLENMKSLIRPGRLDKVIELCPCDGHTDTTNIEISVWPKKMHKN